MSFTFWCWYFKFEPKPDVSLVSLAQRIEPYAIGNANRFNSHSESKSGAIGNQSVLLENNAKTSMGRLSVSQNSDVLVKETKSLGRLAVSQNSVSGNEAKILPCKWPLNLQFLVHCWFWRSILFFSFLFVFYKNWFKLNSSARLWHMFLIASTY